MHPRLRAFYRRSGIANMLVIIVASAALVIQGRWPEGTLTQILLAAGTAASLVFIIDGIGTWWYLRRQKHVSLPNVARLVFVYGVSWDYLRQIEQSVAPQITLVKNHCPELAQSKTWNEALDRNDYIALAVMAEQAVRRNKKAIEQAKRREAQNEALLDGNASILRRLGADELTIAQLRRRGLAAMREAVELMQECRALKRQAIELGIGRIIDSYLRRDMMNEARYRVSRAKTLLERADKLGRRVGVSALLETDQFEAAERLLEAAQDEKLLTEDVALLKVKIATLPQPVQAGLVAEADALCALDYDSRPYRIAKHGLEDRITQAK